MTLPSILIAGLGNIFLGDDRFGVTVAEQLAKRPWPENVKVVDFGIRSLDLSFALLEPHDLVILVDTVQRGEAPGTLYLIEPEVEGTSALCGAGAHDLVPARAMQWARSMGAPVKQLRLVGCEPAHFAVPEQGASGLSPEVSRAVPEALAMIEKLVENALQLSHA